MGNPSWFAKIKYLSKKVPFSISLNEILARYGMINKHRNALFHGDSTHVLTAEEAEVALKAFLWLEDNF